MNDSLSKKSTSDFISAVLIATVIAGSLDIGAAFIQYFLKTDRNPVNVLYYVASGFFGSKAFSGGNMMAMSGLFFHYLTTFLWTLFFFWLVSNFKNGLRFYLIVGIIYGIIVWAVMNLAVIPLSKAPNVRIKFPASFLSLLILIFCIGLPISILANKYYLYKK